MSEKQSKKLRQLFRRELRGEAQRQVQAATDNLDKMMKPTPRFIPEFVWVSLQKIFLNI